MATLSSRPDHEPLISSRIESTPNGRHYGKAGHIPHDHIAVFEYATCQRRYDGEGWTVTPREGNETGNTPTAPRAPAWPSTSPITAVFGA